MVNDPGKRFTPKLGISLSGKTDNVTVTFTFTPALLAKIDSLAKAQGISRVDAVRRLIENA